MRRRALPRPGPSAALLSGALVLAALAACGRTPEPRTAYPCLEDLTADCEGLEASRQKLADAYGDEAARDAPDPVRADDIGACSRTVVEQQLTMKCFADRCETLCEMHPCDVQDDGTCADNCNALVEDEGIAEAALESALLRAAERPGFCTCQVCDDATQALCKDLWVCPGG